MAVSERFTIFGVSPGDPATHRKLATPVGVAEFLGQRGDSARIIQALEQNGTTLRAHIHDAWLARQWIEYAAAERVPWNIPSNLQVGTDTAAYQALRGTRVEFGSAPLAEWLRGPQTPETRLLVRLEVLRIYQSIANYFSALNVSPYAWLPLKIAYEDAFGHPRDQETRRYFRDSELEKKDIDGDPVGTQGMSGEQARYKNGVPVSVVEDEDFDDTLHWTGEPGCGNFYGSSGPSTCEHYGWMRKRMMRAWATRTGTGERFRNVTPVKTENNAWFWQSQPKWGFSPLDLLGQSQRIKADQRVEGNRTNWRFFIQRDFPYVLPLDSGSAERQRYVTYRNLGGDVGAGYVIGGQAGMMSFSQVGHLQRFKASYGSPPDRKDRGWEDDWIWNYVGNDEGDNDHWAWPATKWMYDLLMLPMPGLRIKTTGRRNPAFDEDSRPMDASTNPDLSIVEYLRQKTTADIVREVALYVVACNTQIKRDTGIQTESALASAGVRDNVSRNMAEISENYQSAQRGGSLASGIITGITQAASALSPVAGLVAGAVGAVTRVFIALFSQSEKRFNYNVDVFGRLMPSYEVFTFVDKRLDLIDKLEPLRQEIVELTGAVDEEEDAIKRRQRLEESHQQRLRGLVTAGVVEGDAEGNPVMVAGADGRSRPKYRAEGIAAISQPWAGGGFTSEFFTDGALNAFAIQSLPAAGRRTVVVKGLDPQRGARFFAPDGREFTTGAPQLGRANWIDVDGSQAWVFGVPEELPQLQMLVPGQASKTVNLPPIPVEFSATTSFATAEEGQAHADRLAAMPRADYVRGRTAVISVSELRATPQDTAGGIDVTFVGLPPNSRVVDSSNRDLTTQQPFRAPGGWNADQTAWTIGVPASTLRLGLVYPDGTGRVVPVGGAGLQFPDGVASVMIDAAPRPVAPAIPSGREIATRPQEVGKKLPVAAIAIASVVALGALGYVALRKPRTNPRRARACGRARKRTNP